MRCPHLWTGGPGGSIRLIAFSVVILQVLSHGLLLGAKASTQEALLDLLVPAEHSLLPGVLPRMPAPPLLLGHGTPPAAGRAGEDERPSATRPLRAGNFPWEWW